MYYNTKYEKNCFKKIISGKIMDFKKMFVLSLLVLAAVLQGKELFHFNFKDAGNKKEVISNGFKLISRRVPLLTQGNALRLAATAEIEISGPLPDFRKGFAVSAWVLRKRDIDICPILSSGKYREGQPFVFNAGGEFFSRNGDYQTSGIQKGNRIRRSGVWEHAVAVYGSGKFRFYKDGKLFAEASGKMFQGKGPLYVGAEKELNAVMNYANADMLLNDLRFFSAPIDAAQVAKLYTSERKNYPEGSLIPKGNTVRHALELCFHYAPEGYDPDLKKPVYPPKKRPAPQAVRSSAVRSPGADCAPQLFINGKEHYPYMLYLTKYINHDRYEYLQGGRTAADFAGAGVDLIRVSTGGSGHPYCGWTWFGEGKYNFKVADDRIREVLKNNPNAMLQIMINPGVDAPWFRKKYPDEMERLMLPDGKLYAPISGGLLNSDIWKRAKERLVADYIDHFEKGPFASRIYGYSVGGGASSEWYWPGTFSAGVPGYSKPTRELFKKWLKKRYVTDAALQKAWGDPKVTLDTVTVPLPAERQASETLTLRDPVKAMKVLDFRRCLNDRVIELQKSLLQVVKKHAGPNKIAGTYSGYAFGNQPKHHLSGLNTAGRLLRLPECDYTQLAIVYGDYRRGGASGLCVNPYNGSAMLHGKLLWHEADLRTPYTLNTAPHETGNRHTTMKETAEVIKRNFGNALTRNSGIYEMLLTGHTTYHHKTIMDAVSQVRRAGAATVGKVRKSVAEIAVIHDEHSADFFAWPNSKNRRFFTLLMHDFHYNTPKAGAPVDFYLMDDLTDPRMKDYKLYIFLTAVAVTPEMRIAINKKLARNNASAAWFFTPGLIENGRFAPEAMEKLTGIKFNVRMGSENLKVSPVKASPLFSKGGTILEMNYGPVPVPVSKGQIVHATAAGRPAVVEVNKNGRKSFYSLLPPTAEMVRSLAEMCKIHIYTDSADIFNINSTHIMLHAVTGGVKTVKLPGKYDISDAVTGKKLFSGVSSFKVAVPRHESRIFSIEKK